MNQPRRFALFSVLFWFALLVIACLNHSGVVAASIMPAQKRVASSHQVLSERQREPMRGFRRIQHSRTLSADEKARARREIKSKKSLAPSVAPTLSTQPTAAPTAQPTSTPTHKPSASPTTSQNPTAAPTQTPSAPPTPVPTSVPSKQPTAMPTLVPTRMPTMSPSAAPSVSSKPTSKPSLRPSATPTKLPTSMPSKQPSAVPTRLPTQLPTARPTLLPTPMPSELPTQLPTATPTKLPSTFPSPYPTMLPSVPPSDRPSRVPSSLPTRLPTSTPTRLPTKTPSVPPTDLPSSWPSLLPTMLPSPSPTQLPTKTPSQHPTDVPSSEPSRRPTSSPTHLPTQLPTSSPSLLPTAPPSISPSLLPTLLPSALPTETPTARPSKTPSWTPTQLPSFQPTNSQQPSKMPSLQPSFVPSLLPTQEPSAPPSRQPSKMPSKQPTSMPSPTPSRVPTTTPSKQPSHMPSIPPSREPTGNPTEPPSAEPTMSMPPTVDPLGYEQSTDAVDGSSIQTCRRSIPAGPITENFKAQIAYEFEANILQGTNKNAALRVGEELLGQGIADIACRENDPNQPFYLLEISSKDPDAYRESNCTATATTDCIEVDGSLTVTLATPVNNRGLHQDPERLLQDREQIDEAVGVYFGDLINLVLPGVILEMESFQSASVSAVTNIAQAPAPPPDKTAMYATIIVAGAASLCVFAVLFVAGAKRRQRQAELRFYDSSLEHLDPADLEDMDAEHIMDGTSTLDSSLPSIPPPGARHLDSEVPTSPYEQRQRVSIVYEQEESSMTADSSIYPLGIEAMHNPRRPRSSSLPSVDEEEASATIGVTFVRSGFSPGFSPSQSPSPSQRSDSPELTPQQQQLMATLEELGPKPLIRPASEGVEVEDTVDL